MDLNITLETMGAAWASALADGKRPVSWNIHTELHGTYCGILAPSFAHRAGSDIVNLVLWTWGGQPPRKVEVIDPTGRLPKNRKSWE